MTWQTIDTAPHDGTLIEGCRSVEGEEFLVFSCCWRPTRNQFRANEPGKPGDIVRSHGWRWGLNGHAVNPTHWRAHPDKPA